MANVSHLLLTRINHESTMVRKIANLFENEILTDVTLSCEGQMINAHKLILSTASSYFQSIFQNSLIRNQVNPVIIIKDMKLVDLRNIIEFIYSGEVYVNEDQLESLVKSAESLNVSGLSRVDPSRRSHFHCNHDLNTNDTLPQQNFEKIIKNTQNENKPTQEKPNNKKAILKKIKENDEEINEPNLPESKYKQINQKMNSFKQLSPPRYNFRIKSKDNCNGNLNDACIKKKIGIKPFNDNQDSSVSADISKSSKKKIKATENTKISSSSNVSKKVDKTLKCSNEQYLAIPSTSLSSKEKKLNNLNECIELENTAHFIKNSICNQINFSFANKMDALTRKEQCDDSGKIIHKRASLKSLSEDKNENENSHFNNHGSVMKKLEKQSSKIFTRTSINYPIIKKTRGVKTTDMLKKKHGAKLAAKKLKASKASLNAKKATWNFPKYSNVDVTQDSKVTSATKSTSSTLEKIIAKAKRKRGRPKKIGTCTTKIENKNNLKQKKSTEIKVRMRKNKEKNVSDTLIKGTRMKWISKTLEPFLNLESCTMANDLKQI